MNRPKWWAPFIVLQHGDPHGCFLGMRLKLTSVQRVFTRSVAHHLGDAYHRSFFAAIASQLDERTRQEEGFDDLLALIHSVPLVRMVLQVLPMHARNIRNVGSMLPQHALQGDSLAYHGLMAASCGPCCNAVSLFLQYDAGASGAAAHCFAR